MSTENEPTTFVVAAGDGAAVEDAQVLELQAPLRPDVLASFGNP